jgi:hypothetical protein
MKVFISWSGPLSKRVAESLKLWVQCMLQATEPFLSSEDIDKGAIWFGEVGRQLASSDVGIVCLTKDNRSAPWILFEAGALAKGLLRNRVCTFLVDIVPTDLIAPLSQFQSTTATKEDMLKLATTINDSLEKPLAKDLLETTFNSFWDRFKQGFDAAVKEHQSTASPVMRTPSELAGETLEICRSIQRTLEGRLLVSHSEMAVTLDPEIAVMKTIIAQAESRTASIESQIAMTHDVETIKGKEPELEYERAVLNTLRRELDLLEARRRIKNRILGPDTLRA